MAHVLSIYAGLFSGLVIGLLSISLLALGAAIFLDSERAMQLVRSYWYARMRGTRFMLMLRRCGVGPRLYLNQSGGSREVRRALNNCRRCPHHAQCDRDLACGSLASVPTYCPNAALIGRHAALASAAGCAGI